MGVLGMPRRGGHGLEARIQTEKNSQKWKQGEILALELTREGRRLREPGRVGYRLLPPAARSPERTFRRWAPTGSSFSEQLAAR